MVKCECMTNWNLPNLLYDASDWIADNEINVSDITISTFDDPENEVCSTVWKIEIEYYVRED